MVGAATGDERHAEGDKGGPIKGDFGYGVGGGSGREWKQGALSDLPSRLFRGILDIDRRG